MFDVEVEVDTELNKIKKFRSAVLLTNALLIILNPAKGDISDSDSVGKNPFETFKLKCKQYHLRI